MLELKANVREIMGRKTKNLRGKNIIPAVVYGNGEKSVPIQILFSDFEKIFKQARESSLIDLKIEGQGNKKVLVHAIQYHPLTDRVEHVDFYQIKAGEKIAVEVKLNFIGISKAVKDFNGILVHEMDKIEVECLPKDLIKDIEVDLTGLTELNNVIKVGDLKVPENVKILSDLDSSVVSVKAIKIKEETKEETEEEVKKEKGDSEKKEGGNQKGVGDSSVITEK